MAVGRNVPRAIAPFKMTTPLGFQGVGTTSSLSQGGPRNAPNQTMPSAVRYPLGAVSGEMAGGTVGNPLVQAIQNYRGA